MSATSFDADARVRAVDPSRNVVLEASAGTGKTRVLVERYVNLLLAGVEPEHILAITFTRKAAAEMRQRIVERLKEASRTSQLSAAMWRELRERLGEISISTIDAFCLSLIREFPLEADVDPGFDLADETEIPRLVGEALDRALRVGRHLAQTDPDVAMVFVQLRERKLREGLAALLDRRLVAADVLRRFLDFGPRDLTLETACRRTAERLADALGSAPGGLNLLLADGPLGHPQFAMLAPTDLACARRACLAGPPRCPPRLRPSARFRRLFACSSIGSARISSRRTASRARRRGSARRSSRRITARRIRPGSGIATASRPSRRPSSRPCARSGAT